MKGFIKKNWSNLLFIVVLALMLIPQTRMPIQVFLQRLLSFSPSEIAQEEQIFLDDYYWELSNLQGVTKNLASDKGNVIVVNLWATWCPPCVAEMPSLQRLANTYKDQVSFYFIADEAPQKLTKFMEKNAYDFPVYNPVTNPPSLLASRSLPTTYVIAKDGRVVIKKIGAADWDSDMMHNVLTRLLNE